jgi:hypothetical protein
MLMLFFCRFKNFRLDQRPSDEDVNSGGETKLSIAPSKLNEIGLGKTSRSNGRERAQGVERCLLSSSRSMRPTRRAALGWGQPKLRGARE